MQGGKTEGKIAGPLFPRLHVNDTEKGGPKPPPRNKMALYEQLSIPSHRFTDAPAAMLPLPPIYGGTLAEMESSSQGIGLEKSTNPPIQNSAASYHSHVRQGSFSTDDGILNKNNGNSVKSLMTTHTGEINDTDSVFPTGMCNSLQPCNITQVKCPPLLKNETELKARSLFHPAVNSDCSHNQSNIHKERYLVGSSSLRLQPTVVKRLKTSSSADQIIEKNLKVLKEDGLKASSSGQAQDKTICNLPQASRGNNRNVTTVVKATDHLSPPLSLKPITGEENSELPNQMPTSPNSQEKSSELNETGTSDAWGHTEEQLNKVRDPTVQPKVSAINSACVLRIEPCHESPAVYSNNRPLKELRNEDENESGPVPANVLNRNEDHSSNVSALKRVSCAFISPEDVVELIGDKQFWKVRRAIISQQRVFSMQVFELHRIIKVQRIIAGSRHLLMEESMFLREAITKPSSVKQPLYNLVPENPSSVVKLREEVPKSKVAADNPVLKQPHMLLNDNFTSPTAKTGHNFGNSAAVPSSLDNKLPMWCLPSLGNQWLVPVMSPSEGLIYKPYTEPPCPPPGGFPPSVYGGYGESLRPPCGYNLPVAPPIGPTYFAPYGMPTMNPSISAPTIEHIAAKAVDSKDIYSVYQSSCVVASERHVVSKDSEKLEDKVLPKTMTPEDALPLFPTVPTGCGSVQPVTSAHSNEQKMQVIKVIPRNPRLASESAARIIQLIQEEKKQLCD